MKMKIRLLCCFVRLPPPYKNFGETLVYSNKSLKLKEVKAFLYSKELFDKELSSSHSDNPAKFLVVRGRSSMREPSSSSRPRLKSKSKNSQFTVIVARRNGILKLNVISFRIRIKKTNRKLISLPKPVLYGMR